MQDARAISTLGFVGLISALGSLVAVALGLSSPRLGIWLFTLALGVYGVVLALGRWLEHEAEQERRRSHPKAASLLTSRSRS